VESQKKFAPALAQLGAAPEEVAARIQEPELTRALNERLALPPALAEEAASALSAQ
jgi:hypothetical protein